MYLKINTYRACGRDASTLPGAKNSNRYNPGNRNRRNSSDINDITFSNRYKTGGSDDATSIATLSGQGESKGPSSYLTISNRNNPGNRNRRNPPAINNLIFSNRNKTRGSFEPNLIL